MQLLGILDSEVSTGNVWHPAAPPKAPLEFRSLRVPIHPNIQLDMEAYHNKKHGLSIARQSIVINPLKPVDLLSAGPRQVGPRG